MSALASGLDGTLERFFDEVAPLDRGDTLLIAFSGGPDSTALLAAAAGFARPRKLGLLAAHLDHGLDEGSSDRAARAADLADRIGVPLICERASPDDEDLRRRGLEDWARRARYGFLERVRRQRDARYVATAHHRGDQIETVLLRVLMGSGLAGLGAIEPRRGSVVRPLLCARREQLERELARAGLTPVDDPTNRDGRRPRTLVRERLVPALVDTAPGLDECLLRIAEHARRLATAIEPRLADHLALAVADDGDSADRRVSVDLKCLRELPFEVRSLALALLHRRAGSPYPAGGPARSELERQLAAGGRIGSDCGRGWRWEGYPRTRSPHRLVLRRHVAASTAAFAYTLRIPGELAIPELDLRVSIAREPVDDWVFEGHPRRAALDLPIADGDHLTVRNRLPGDRLQPLGCDYRRRLKDVLIDAGVPREERDRIPLVCLGNRIVWVPGLTIDENSRIKKQKHAWIARIEPIEPPG